MHCDEDEHENVFFEDYLVIVFLFAIIGIIASDDNPPEGLKKLLLLLRGEWK